MIVTTSVLSISSELFLRRLFRDVTTTSDNLSWFSKQWLKTVSTNRFGFRERDFDPVKAIGAYRIAVVGDSLAYGQGIPQRERFSNIVEERLNRLGNRNYEVLNFGQPGAETTDELGVLTRMVLPARPDFVLLQWFINDVQGPEDKSGAPKPMALVPASLRLNSVFFYLFHYNLDLLQSRLGLSDSGDAYTLARFKDPGSPSSLAATVSMTTFMEICRRFDIPLGLVLFSDSYFKPDAETDFLVDRVMQLCQEKRLHCVDTRPTLRSYQGDAKLWANRLDAHPGSLAHQLVADQLMETFGDTWREGTKRTQQPAGAGRNLSGAGALPTPIHLPSG